MSNNETSYPIFYYGNARYFLKAINYVPYYRNKNNPDKTNSELKVIYAVNSISQKLLINVLNSKVYYWLWTLYSDCFHVDYKLLGMISNNFSLRALSGLSEKLMRSMKQNSIKKSHGENVITEFNVREALPVIETIDKLISKSLRLNKSEDGYLMTYAEDVRGSNKKKVAA